MPEGLKHKRDPEEPTEALHGRNNLGNVGYDGPQGSVGQTHRYRLRLLALDRPLDSRTWSGGICSLPLPITSWTRPLSP